jgi:hypothetical protein
MSESLSSLAGGAGASRSRWAASPRFRAGRRDMLARIDALDASVGAYLAASTATARAPRPTQIDAGASRGEQARAARGRADRGQGQHRHQGPASPPPAPGSSPAGTRPTTPTVVERLRAAGAVFVGKPTATSSRWARPPRTRPSARPQPLGLLARPGRLVRGARRPWRRASRRLLGTDTGGSIRQPAAFCGRRPQAHLRPGVALGPDRLRVVARSDRPLARPSRMPRSAGADRRPRSARRDQRSIEPCAEVSTAASSRATCAACVKIGLPASTSPAGSTPACARASSRARSPAGRRRELRRRLAAAHSLALPTYYLIAPAEASSNLARYDGVRYGRAPRRTDLRRDVREARAAPASAPRSSAGSCSAPTCCAPATTTPTTARRSRCGR